MSKKLAADYFGRHTGNECHITSDGRVFHTKGSADSFANGLKDTTVQSFTREGKKEEIIGEDTGEDTKVIAIETLKTFDTATASYHEIKALVKALGLETPSQLQVDLVASLEAQKVIINTEIED